MNDKKYPSVYPDEVPFGMEKELSHGAIVDVVQNEINVPHSTNPAAAPDTDAINTEFAKEALKKDTDIE
ncbi:MAG: hypothetical protein ACI4GZ_03205 [Ruminococcus sp.]